MQVKIGNYCHQHLMCNIHDRHMDKKYKDGDWPEIQDYEDYVLKVIEDGVQSVYNVFNWLWFDKRTPKVKVRIDYWDTWCMDNTLASIILPMLVQLKETKHGAPIVDNECVPKELRMSKKDMEQFTKDGSPDDNFFARWDWIMDEMIWTFEQKNRDNWESDYYGPYIMPIGNPGPEGFGGHFEWKDDKGRNAHQERMTNGFKLFGKYFEHLWD